MAIFRGEKQVAGMSYDMQCNNEIIDDTRQSSDTVYSSTKTESRLKEVENSINAGQNDQVKMWQKTYLNVVNGDTLNINVSSEYTLERTIVQVYKFIEGTNDTIEILKKFDNTDANNFYYDENKVEFTGSMRIIDEFRLNKSLNSDGYYETDIIDLSRFVNFFKIEEV